MRKLLCWLLFAATLAMSACTAQTSHQESIFGSEKAKGIDSVRMRGDLISFTDYATSEISTAATDIATTTQKPRYREMALSWRLRLATAMHTIAGKPDPRQGLVLAWMLAVKQRLYFEAKLAGDPSDPEVALMVETARNVEENISAIIAKYLTPENFTRAQEQILVLAREKPLTGVTGINRFGQQDINPAQAPDAVSQILLLPLAPLTGMQGVTDTATAVNRLNAAVSTLSLLIDDLPLQARWQAQFMVLDLQTSDVAKSLGALAAQLATKADRLTVIADDANKILATLPQILADQQKFITATLDAQRAKVFEDLKKERLEATKSLEQTVASLQKQADGIKTDAAALAQRLQSETLAAIAAERTKAFQDIDAQRKLITQDANAAIDHIFYRAIQLTLVLFVAALILIWFAKRKPATS